MLSITTFNCHGFKSVASYVKLLLQNSDIVFLSEHWLLDYEKFLLLDDCCHHELIFSPASKKSVGRPFGGNALSSFFDHNPFV